MRHRTWTWGKRALCLLLAGVGANSLVAQPQGRINIPVCDEIPGIPVLMVHHTDTRVNMMRGRQEMGRFNFPVMVAAWEDGTVVWSRNRLTGGEPYYQANVGPERVAEIVGQLCEGNAALPPNTPTNHFGPDASYNTIVLWGGECHFQWRTWHEVYEAHGRVVAVDGALTVLPEGRIAEEVRREKSSEMYLRFIDAWVEARATAQSLIPEDPASATVTALLFRTNWVPLSEEEVEPANEPTDRDRIAAEAVERVADQTVNVYTSEWADLPEPEFITHLMAAIEEGKFSESDWLLDRARELALRRLREHPTLVFPLFIEALEDPNTPNVTARAALVLPPKFQEMAHEDIRAMIERDTLTAERESMLYSGLFGPEDRFEPYWMELANERFADPDAPLMVRVAAGASVYSKLPPGEVLSLVEKAADSSQEPALGAFSLMVARYMTNVALESEENLERARPLIAEALKSGEFEVRKWAAWAIGHVALEYGDHIPYRDKPSADPAMMAAIREALAAEQHWEIHGTLERGLKEMKTMYE